MVFSVINQLQGGEPFPATGTGSAAPVTGNVYYSIPIKADWGAFTDWQITIGAVTGSPTSGAGYSAKFQIWVPNRTPNVNQDDITIGAWLDVDPTTNPEMFPTGATDWPVLAAYNNAAAKTTMRRIITSHEHRVAITAALAGGTTPGAPLAVRAVSVSR